MRAIVFLILNTIEIVEVYDILITDLLRWMYYPISKIIKK